AQLQEQVAADTARLARVEARLRLIESEGLMDTQDVVLKHVPSVRVAALSAIAPSYASEHIGPVIQPLYDELHKRLEGARLAISGEPVAYYESISDDSVKVHAAFPVNASASTTYDFDIVDLPEAAQAATLIHRGSMENADATFQQLARWIE